MHPINSNYLFYQDENKVVKIVDQLILVTIVTINAIFLMITIGIVSISNAHKTTIVDVRICTITTITHLMLVQLIIIISRTKMTAVLILVQQLLVG